MRTYRYFEWATASGGQLSGDQLMDALSDYLTEDGDVSRAMQMLMQRGMSSGEQKMQGLRDMLEQLRKRKQQHLDKYDLNSLLSDIREQLDQLLQQERQTIAEQLQEAQTTAANGAPQPSTPQTAEAGQRREFLDNLPDSVPQQIQELRHYDFLDPQAAQAFQELLEELQQRAMQSQLNGTQASSESSAADTAQGQRDMYQDLNQQLREKLQGRQGDFQQFKDQHPQFPSAQEETIEELIQQLQQQLQQWRSLLESLSESVRRDLEQLMDTTLDADLQAQRAELQELLDQLAEKKTDATALSLQGA